MKKYFTKENGKYLLQAIFMLGIVLAIAYGSFLNTTSLMIIIAYAIIIIPLIIKSMVKQSRSVDRFNNLCNYLTNIIPIFMQKTKIRFTLGELYEICDGSIRNTIYKAIEYIDNTKDDPRLLENGLKIIEKEYPNSRVKSVHKFLLGVENSSSGSYKKLADNLYEDIEGWIKRTFNFQKDLKNRQTKILLLCVITLIMNVMFVFIYVSNDYFKGFVDNIYYQMSTTVFIALVLFIIAVVIVRLNGEWLIDDANTKDEEEFKKKYRYYKKGKQKVTALDIVLTIIVCLIGIYYIYIKNNITGVSMLIIAFMLISQKSRKYVLAKQYISKKFTIEFPIWLREVSLSLGDLTVLNSIENSLNASSYPFRRETRRFLEKANNNPTSIVPYNDFLNEYSIDDVKFSMRVLYAVNNVSKSEMQERTSKIIERNQELLAKAENIRNEDSIGGIEMIGYIPTVLFSIQMMISMVVMFNYMLGILGGQFRF